MFYVGRNPISEIMLACQMATWQMSNSQTVLAGREAGEDSWEFDVDSQNREGIGNLLFKLNIGTQGNCNTSPSN